MYAGWSVSTFLNKEEYQSYERSIEQQVVDEDFIALMDQQYRDMVDANRRSDEEILHALEENEEVLNKLRDEADIGLSADSELSADLERLVEKILYDPDYAYYVFPEEYFYSSQELMDYVERK